VGKVSFEAVALALDGDRRRVVQQAVEDRRGEHRVAGEDLSPFAVALVGGQDDRAVLVALRHDLEEQGSALGLEGQEADLVDDQEPRS